MPLSTSSALSRVISRSSVDISFLILVCQVVPGQTLEGAGPESLLPQSLGLVLPITDQVPLEAGVGATADSLAVGPVTRFINLDEMRPSWR